MSRRLDAMAVLKAVLERAVQQHATLMAWDETPSVEVKPANEPLKIPEQSLVIIRDMGLQTPVSEIGRGPSKAIRECTQRAQIEIYMLDQPAMGREEAVSGLANHIGETLEIDPTLGDEIDDSDIQEAAADSFGDEGQDTVAGAAISITMTWYSERALG